MSDKQVGLAAYNRRRLAFQTTVDTVRGYVVGMDDFHWLVAVPQIGNGREAHLVLVHKTCPLVDFSEVFLEMETEDNKTFIRRVGMPFWEWCGRTYRGLSDTNDEETEQ
jgi:hypothetical protein